MKNCTCGCKNFVWKDGDRREKGPIPTEDFNPNLHNKPSCWACNKLLAPELSKTPITDAACRKVDPSGFTREYEELSVKVAESLEIAKVAAEAERDDLRGRVIELECALKWWLNERMACFSDQQYGKGKMRDILLKGSLSVQEG